MLAKVVRAKLITVSDPSVPWNSLEMSVMVLEPIISNAVLQNILERHDKLTTIKAEDSLNAPEKRTDQDLVYGTRYGN